MIIRSVGVLGCGVMGQGIARASAGAGLPTILFKVVSGAFTTCAVRAKFEDGLKRDVTKGKLREQAWETILTNLSWSCKISDLKDCDLIVESVVENLLDKQEMFRQIDYWAKPGAIFASNTSTLSISELARVTSRANRFLGLHFFNPVSVMNLVEVARIPNTDADVVETAQSFVRALGKTPVVTSDAPGFVVNRLLTPYLLDAIRSFEGGLGSIEDLDQSMKLGCGHPMGPFALCDYIGLDIVLAMAMNLYDRLKEERFAPPPLLRHLVASGMLGRKTKKGFYDYTTDPARPNSDLSTLMSTPVFKVAVD